MYDPSANCRQLKTFDVVVGFCKAIWGITFSTFRFQKTCVPNLWYGIFVDCVTPIRSFKFGNLYIQTEFQSDCTTFLLIHTPNHQVSLASVFICATIGIVRVLTVRAASTTRSIHILAETTIKLGFFCQAIPALYEHIRRGFSSRWGKWSLGVTTSTFFVGIVMSTAAEFVKEFGMPAQSETLFDSTALTGHGERWFYLLFPLPCVKRKEGELGGGWIVKYDVTICAAINSFLEKNYHAFKLPLCMVVEPFFWSWTWSGKFRMIGRFCILFIRRQLLF